ncbi:Flavin-dependent oxidoreductase, luciferase family (includes alkanesulfonate monooxygenase SsuD and methylene tetrahydromethanopterin reductase) [Collimonas sp. OK607]|uniref:LLM class flavin-dependent oxidoreductase n=1 Tax=Collimonas sp. OK607 TaxID=1798194 RepID=UPI0008E3F135|nr:LLM class flavin-dependent oxidoreductase [Collimonas sp. OK607]SFA95118.1 Flavin-dependent oxidoreductase, luciferase family (includes alkanesulfonate monooxygenase SsuD and methylene tetrahydromethanopterin reductase) [Collimonas sp. OK607]
MKFSLLLHMERYNKEKSQRELFNEMTELVQIAEAGGFETAWVGEHHGMEFTVAPNPFVNLAYLSAKTTKIRLGTGTVIAPFWHPIKLAGEAGMIDIASDGRLDIGIARGAYSFEYERLYPGLDAFGAGARLREMVPALQKLFDGDYAHQGEFWSFPTTTSQPRPVQKQPPLWVAARDPNSHDFAVANKCNLQVTSLAAGDAEVVSLMERFNNACAAHPEIPRPKIMMLMHTFVGEDEAEVCEAAKDLGTFYCYFSKMFKNARPVDEGFIETLTAEDIASFPNYTADMMRKNLVIGQPQQVVERLKMYESLGYDQYSFWIDSHMSFERKKKSLELFIDQVMPAFSA